MGGHHAKVMWILRKAWITQTFKLFLVTPTTTPFFIAHEYKKSLKYGSIFLLKKKLKYASQFPLIQRASLKPLPLHHHQLPLFISSFHGIAFSNKKCTQFLLIRLFIVRVSQSVWSICRHYHITGKTHLSSGLVLLMNMMMLGYRLLEDESGYARHANTKFTQETTPYVVGAELATSRAMREKRSGGWEME